ncbi:MAG: hypothetical protein QGH39_09670 [Candidatus Thermoplasmatota archaeon]|jgi:hypothetical protein|nr:hypothetical protein [Candidatus Thermoplasmatota archaeon]
MSIPLYTEIAKCNQFIQELFLIEDDKITIESNPFVISEKGELFFSNIKPRSLQESLSYLIEFIHVMEKAVTLLSERKNDLWKVLKKSKSLRGYIDKKDRRRFEETWEIAESTISDLAIISENIQKLLLIKEGNLDFCRREARNLLSSIFREVAPILKKYHGLGIAIDPIDINIKIEVMDI